MACPEELVSDDPMREPFAHGIDDEDELDDGDFKLWIERWRDEESFEPTNRVFAMLSADELRSDWDETVSQHVQRVQVKDDLCQGCHRLLYPSRCAGENIANMRPTFSTAQSAAGARVGCKLCSLIKSSLEVLGKFDLLRRIEQRVDHLPLEIAVRNQETNILCLFVSLWAWSRQGYILELVIKDAVEQTKGMTLARQWLESCVSSHDCISRYQGLRLPTRLLCLLNGQIRLVDTRDSQIRPQYATLSYCWGKGSDFRLTEHTFAALLAGISYEFLPATIRDAIAVAQAMGLQWLWVDALCIMQDDVDHKDWRTEAAIMGDIYGGGYLNIAASTSLDVHDGALKSPLADLALKLLGEKVVYLREAWSLAVTKSPLSRRGWAFQERLLAPRTLYLSSLGIFWECSTERHTDIDDDSDEILRYSTDNLCIGRRHGWDWEELIEEYSRTKLSHQGDRLVAIAGLARCQHALTGGDYCAGLWRESIEFQLGWWRVDHLSRCRQPWAPTWSWTCIDRSVKFWAKGKRKLINHVVDVRTTLVSDAFGEIQGGRLEIAFHCLATVQVQRGVIRWEKLAPDNAFFPDAFFPDTLEDQDFEGEGYIVPLFDVEDSHSVCTMKCLVLWRCGGTFKRLWLYSALRAHGWLPYQSPLYPVLEKSGEAMAAAVCSEKLADGRFVLVIV